MNGLPKVTLKIWLEPASPATVGSSYKREVFTVREGVSAGDTVVGSARGWKGAAKGVGLEAPASGNRKLEREHTRPSFDAGDVRIAASGKTKLALEAPALEPRLSSLRPSATGSPTCP